MTGMLASASRRLGRYELLSYLGSGGMSDVYVALHTGLRKRVALKLLRASLRRDHDATQRFLREGECAARVRHPNVVDVSDLGIDNGVPYLVMELLEGETLAQRIARQGPLELAQAIDLFLPVLDAVSAVHAAGVLHRDVKPANIVLARAGNFGSRAEEPLASTAGVQPKLVDFGIARLLEGDDRAERALGPLGTPHYMAPEQARGERVDERCDQYALASVLFEMLTGREPYVGQTVDAVLAEVARGRFPRISTLRPDLPSDLEDALTRATQRNPNQRFASLEAFSCALVPFASERTRQLWLAQGSRSQHALAQLVAAGMRPSSVRTVVREPVLAVPSVTPRARPRRSARRIERISLRALAGTAALGLGLMAGMGVTRGFAETPPPAQVRAPLPEQELAVPVSPLAPAPVREVTLEPVEAVAALDGVEIGRGSFRLPELTPGLHELRVHAPGHVARVVLFHDALPEPVVRLEKRRR